MRAVLGSIVGAALTLRFVPRAPSSPTGWGGPGTGFPARLPWIRATTARIHAFPVVAPLTSAGFVTIFCDRFTRAGRAGRQTFGQR